MVNVSPQVLARPASLDQFLSDKLRFWSLVSMLCLVYVHAFNLHPRYLDPWTQVAEPPTLGNCLQYFLANGLLRFRIPMLFAISGYLLAWRDNGTVPYGQRVRRRLRTLGLPYVLWSLLWLAVALAAERLALFNAAIKPVWSQQLREHGAGWLLLNELQRPVPFQLWFLRRLLVYNLAYPWLKLAILRWPRLYFSLTGCMWFALLGIPLLADSEGLLFFGLGVWLGFHRREVQVAPAWFRLAWFQLAWLAVAVLNTWLAFRGAPAYPPALKLLMLALYKIGEISGILVAWFGLDWLVRRAMARPWFRWLAGFSFMIYVLHVPLVNYATDLALYYGRGLPHLPALVFLLMPLAVTALSVALAAGLRRVAPRVYSVLTGGRGLATA